MLRGSGWLRQVIVVSVCLTGWGCENAKPPAKTKALPVVTGSAQVEDVPITVRGVGQTRAIRIAPLAPQRAGTIVKLPFPDGGEVKKDQVLIHLDPSNEQAEVDALEAQLAEAQRDLEKAQELAAAKTITPEQLESAQTTRNQVRGQLDAARVRLSKMNPVAAFDGRLSITPLNPGDYLDAGAWFGTLVDDDPLYIDYQLPQQHAGRLSADQRVEVASMDGRTRIDGKVIAVDPSITQESRAIGVRALADNADGRFHSGESVVVVHHLGQRKQAMLLPQIAIALTQKGPTVYTVEDGKAKANAVKLGAKIGHRVVIESGLEPGDEVVIEGWKQLHDGAAVRGVPPIATQGQELLK